MIAPVGGVAESAPARPGPEARRAERLKGKAAAQEPAKDLAEGGGLSFTGKLVVLATSSEATPKRNGTKVSVAGQPGYLGRRTATRA